MSMKYMCDRCGKEIPADGRYYVRIQRKDSIPLKSHLNCTPEEWEGMELCEGCKELVVGFAFARPEAPNQEFKAAVEKLKAGNAGPIPKRTNLDRIREMPASELANLLGCACCSFYEHNCDCTIESCLVGTIEWLNQEVKDRDEENT